MLSRSIGYSAFVLLSACSASAPPAPQNAGNVQREPTEVRVPRQLITPTETTSVSELYARGESQAKLGKFREAAADFDRAFALEPRGERAPDALFRAAEAFDLVPEHREALARYEQTARLFPEHALGREALVRSIRLLAYLEEWPRAGELSDLFLSREKAPKPFELVVAHSGKALALIADGDDVKALASVERARDVIERHGLDLAGRLPRDLAQVYYALGEIRRVRAERIALAPVTPDFLALLEKRCQLILDAQSAYSDTMRAYDSHWSAMAGFRVGELYQRLHEELMKVEAPKAKTERERQLVEGAMRLRYSVLLTKAKGMMEHTLDMARRTGESSSWVERAEQARRDIEKAEAAEQAALDKLPYTREELQAALDRLAKGQKP
jgi:tetratricopeptide (TPR) repeat protein